MAQSVYLIKPEGMKHLGKIRRMILDVGLVIIFPRPFFPSEEDLRQLYPDLPQSIWKATLEHLKDQRCEIALVESEMSTSLRLMDVCGESTDPALCAERTIRRMFGTTTELPDGKKYHKNVIHRPQNAVEAERNRIIFGL